MGAKVNKTSSQAAKPIQDIKYMDLMQIDIKKFNNDILKAREQFIQENKEDGKEKLEKILSAHEDHPLRRHRNIDFRISKTDMQDLLKNKIYWYKDDKFSKDGLISSFAHFYLKTFENDMPVYITTDSILYAFHKSFNNLMSYIECSKLAVIWIQVLLQATKNINTIRDNISKSEDTKLQFLLKEIEKLVIVSYTLLTRNLLNVEESSFLGCKTTADGEALILAMKVKAGLYNLDKDLDETLKKDVDEIIQLVDSKAIAPVCIFNKKKTIDFSMLIPRARYEGNDLMKSFFQSVMWFSLIKFHIKTEIQIIWALSKIFTDKPNDEVPNYLELFLNAYTYISGKSLNKNFVEISQIGVSMGLKNLILDQNQQLQLYERLISDGKSSELIDLLREVKYPNQDMIKNIIDPDFLEQHDILNLYSLVPQSITIDTWLMYEITGKDFIPPRRLISAHDIIYALFQNDDVRNVIEARCYKDSKMNGT